MKRLLLIPILIAFSMLLQGCGILGSMLFDPLVRTAFSVPEQSEVEVIKNDPGEYYGKHIVVTGVVTAVRGKLIEVDRYLMMDGSRLPDFASIKVGDRIAVQGNFSAYRFSSKKAELRYAIGNVLTPNYGTSKWATGNGFVVACKLT